MTGDEIWRTLHLLSVFLYVGGLGAVLAPMYRAWRSKDVEVQMIAFRQAADSETSLLLPGLILTGVTGVFWAVSKDYNFIRDGWLGVLTLLYIFTTFIALPLLGLGLRRVRLLSLEAAKHQRITPELEEALADNVPRVFGTVILILTPVMAWLAIVKPF
ncbi:MAG TPA: DUF2269 family protein [Dehalococcoidia bacterium]